MGNSLCQEAHPSAIQEEDKRVPVAELLSGDSAKSPGSDASNDLQAEEAKQEAIEATATPPDLPLDAKTVEEQEDGSTEDTQDEDGEGEEGIKEVVLHTAPIDPRFPTSNAARYCYTAYNEYYKCLKEKQGEDQECERYAHTYRSLCPDEWIAKWNELREAGTWFGKY